MYNTGAPPPPPPYGSLGLPGQPQHTPYAFGVPQQGSLGQPQHTPYAFGVPQQGPLGQTQQTPYAYAAPQPGSLGPPGQPQHTPYAFGVSQQGSHGPPGQPQHTTYALGVAQQGSLAQPQQTPSAYGAPQQGSFGPPGQPQQTSYGFGAPQPAIPMQPTPAEAQWMSRPDGPAGCPPGLEYLCQVNQLNLQQEIEESHGEDVYGPTANWFRIMNGSGQQMYTAIEDLPRLDGLCVCLPGQRGYTVNIRDNLGHVVMRVVRDPLCCFCCSCLGCEHVVQIEAPVGHVIGYFKSLKSIGSTTFTISNPEDEVIFTMNFPCCATQLYLHEQKYFINSKDGVREVARITKHWQDMELIYRPKKYTLSFPSDLDEKMKAVLLGTLFGIDAMYYAQLEGQETSASD